MNRAREVLAASGDPQQADFVLDRACYEEPVSYTHLMMLKYK